MHQRRLALSRQPAERGAVASELTADTRQPPRREQRAAQDREPGVHDHLDSLGAQVFGEGAWAGQHGEGAIPLRVQSGGQGQQLAVGAVAAGRRVDVEDGARHALRRRARRSRELEGVRFGGGRWLGKAVGVQHVAEQLEAVDQPGTGTGEVGGGVDGHDLAGSERVQAVAIGLGLLAGRAGRRSRTA